MLVQMSLEALLFPANFYRSKKFKFLLFILNYQWYTKLQIFPTKTNLHPFNWVSIATDNIKL